MYYPFFLLLSIVALWCGCSGQSINGHSFSDHINPKIGIPIGTWSILDLNATQRMDICQQQKQFCANDCGGNQSIAQNFCDDKTMHWGCSCQNKIPNTLPYEWPMTVAECNGKDQACQSGCGTGGDTAEVCRSQCSSYFKCNRPGSEPSSLRLDYPPSPTSSSLSLTTSSLSFFVSFCILFNLIII